MPLLHALAAAVQDAQAAAGDGAASGLVARVAAAAEPWRALYADSRAVSVAVTFLHLGGMLVGGGLALAADRATLRALRGTPADRERQLAALGITHAPVLGALAVVFLSGAALFLADVEEYAPSRLYWAKMVLVALLLANGARMAGAERTLRIPGVDPDRAATLWRGLRASAVASGILWLLTLLAGTALAG